MRRSSRQNSVLDLGTRLVVKIREGNSQFLRFHMGVFTSYMILSLRMPFLWVGL